MVSQGTILSKMCRSKSAFPCVTSRFDSCGRVRPCSFDWIVKTDHVERKVAIITANDFICIIFALEASPTDLTVQTEDSSTNQAHQTGNDHSRAGWKKISERRRRDVDNIARCCRWFTMFDHEARWKRQFRDKDREKRSIRDRGWIDTWPWASVDRAINGEGGEIFNSRITKKVKKGAC